jgi:hypothetical protein
MSTKVHLISRGLYFFTGSIRYQTWRLVKTCLIPKVDLHKIRPEVSLRSSLPSVKCPSTLVCTLTLLKFNVYWFVHRKYFPICIQQDATLHSLFISGNSSTYFGWYLHPSSGAHKLYLQHLVFVRPLLLPAAIATDSSNGLTNTRCCRYSLCAPDDGWKYHPKYVEEFPDINKLCKVASCWIHIGILLKLCPWIEIALQ